MNQLDILHAVHLEQYLPKMTDIHSLMELTWLKMEFIKLFEGQRVSSSYIELFPSSSLKEIEDMIFKFHVNSNWSVNEFRKFINGEDVTIHSHKDTKYYPEIIPNP